MQLNAKQTVRYYRCFTTGCGFEFLRWHPRKTINYDTDIFQNTIQVVENYP
jgi:hypothetical protein